MSLRVRNFPLENPENQVFLDIFERSLTTRPPKAAEKSVLVFATCILSWLDGRRGVTEPLQDDEILQTNSKLTWILVARRTSQLSNRDEHVQKWPAKSIDFENDVCF